MIALQDLASPVGAFVRDRCEIDAGHEIPVDELWEAWKSWAEDNGHNKSTKQRFGRDLRAAHARVRVVHARDGEERMRGLPRDHIEGAPRGGAVSKTYIGQVRVPTRANPLRNAKERVPAQCGSRSWRR
jgi:phage/plasmid-associated DNA primase